MTGEIRSQGKGTFGGRHVGSSHMEVNVIINRESTNIKVAQRLIGRRHKYNAYMFRRDEEARSAFEIYDVTNITFERKERQIKKIHPKTCDLTDPAFSSHWRFQHGRRLAGSCWIVGKHAELVFSRGQQFVELHAITTTNNFRASHVLAR